MSDVKWSSKWQRESREPAGAAGEVEEAFRMAVGTAEAGKPAARIAAVEIALDDLLDDGPEEAEPEYRLMV